MYTMEDYKSLFSHDDDKNLTINLERVVQPPIPGEVSLRASFYLLRSPTLIYMTCTYFKMATRPRRPGSKLKTHTQGGSQVFH